MILERALWIVAAAAAIAAAAAVSIVALAFAVFALLTPYLGAAGAAGAVAFSFALSVGVAGLVAARRARGREQAAVTDRETMNLTQRMMDLVRDRPIAAAGVAAAVGLLAVRNPRMIGAILRAFFDGWQGAERR